MDVQGWRGDLLSMSRPGRQTLRRAGAAVAAGVGVVLAFVALAAVTGEPFMLFSKEPAESVGARPYIGWLAHLGAAVWLASASAALLAGAVLRRLGRTQVGAFLLAFGAYTAVLTIDDLFLVHESVNSRGFPEEILYLSYGATAVLLILRFHREVARNDGVLLLLALGLWATSVGFDVVQETWSIHLHVLEDGSKVVGVVVWAVWLVGAAYRELLAPAREPDVAPLQRAAGAST